MNQDLLPLYNGLLSHIETKPISFHVPGHKSGTVFPPLLSGHNLFQELLKIDQTELRNLDDLHSSSGIIKEAEDLTADLYKVSKSYFLVGGSTAGNLAMILSTCEQADIVLVQRNSHKSILNGLKLAGVQPVFLSPEYDENGQFSTNVSRETVEKAIKMYPDAKVLILTSPNYYGMVSTELQQIIKLAHENSLIVLVDEAHGAHLILGEPFPPSAIQLGADIVVQSAHKTLPAMTMGSFLHCNSDHIDLDNLQYYLQAIQSSSPSYPIMASLDIARYYLAHITESEKVNIVYSINSFREQLATIEQLKVIPTNTKDNTCDPLKVIIQTRCSHSGYELQKEFEKQGIFTELADPWNVLLVLPLAAIENGTNIIKKFKEAVNYVPIKLVQQKNICKQLDKRQDKISTLAIHFNEMKKFKKERVPLLQTKDHIAAVSVIPYPPGIPLILEGEKITNSHINQLLELLNAGAYLQNHRDILKNGLEVFK
ncbi:arginine/lysine/ornithine decarboxylase [Schinkia azotoformans MEV2011]|uniref:Arginine/lysine/ornithine decarboxylase n=1 Tax=Schinkia azotoformans MEV2011 TaxID=1348973 RepID=A0A072NHJ6_SCHAZ|nr:aminotransferase class I/II-fold pyridoxal phosphate-dependent enzyme [Schinkia azotoformans]KEF36393.1 arginine/lysine/ornithine decarboxylase [Schinkia azotoformans MEV2011]MEC1697658.1 aminotransferase class I/II-fold pyridoxal phosphate-dependent enzyme [Schinkia azotoformans]MEC1717365.1 aminotransferase class I/II-fold pyridoxal phosphate-dependent enzyme [Schinkia azotoformans]MEC1726781.1 aminotransferase class I/II-fold pyridoxal phosphate-dependent enzyme [Schinkia azotoformans]ME